MPCRCRPPSRRFLTPLSTCWPAATPSSWPPPWHRHPTRPCCMRTSPRCVPAPPWYRCAVGPGGVRPRVRCGTWLRCWRPSSPRGRRSSPTTRAPDRLSRPDGVTCSVGIAATKFVAKLASGLAKPDGVLLVPRDATVPFLHALPVSSLWGVGDRTGEALARWGITTVAQLAEADVDTVQRAVGRVAGAHLHDLAWGRDPRPVTPEHLDKSVGAETTFDADTTDLAAIEVHVLAMADRCAGHLRSKGLV